MQAKSYFSEMFASFAPSQIEIRINLKLEKPITL